MGIGSNGYYEKWMGIMDLGSNEPKEYWTFVTEVYLGLMSLGNNGPWEY